MPNVIQDLSVIFPSSHMVVSGRLIVLSLKILNGLQSIMLLLRGRLILMNAWVRSQRFPGECQKSHLHPQPLAFTGREVLKTVASWTTWCLCLIYVLCRVNIGINHWASKDEGILSKFWWDLGCESSSHWELATLCISSIFLPRVFDAPSYLVVC